MASTIFERILFFCWCVCRAPVERQFVSNSSELSLVRQTLYHTVHIALTEPLFWEL